jgi:predicted nucleic acid-binding protein
MNIYNRIFDDQNQLRIKLETIAIDMIFELVEEGQHQLCWSFMLEDENNDNPYLHRKSYIKKLSQICSATIGPDQDIKTLAKSIMEKSKIRVKDALHLACAVNNKCNYFITCDDKLIRNIYKNEDFIMRLIGETLIMNPVDFMRKELSTDGLE